MIANYVYDLVKEFNSFYQQVSILGESDEQKKALRVQLSLKVSEVVASGFKLLGIAVPDKILYHKGQFIRVSRVFYPCSYGIFFYF